MMEGWHFLRADRKLAYPPHTLVEVGETLRLGGDGAPALCRVGFHASAKVWDALRYAPGGKELFACRVRLEGVIVTDTDKAVASARTVLAMVPARRILVGWAAWAASGALLGRALRGRAVDPRSWAAIEAVEAWLRGERSEDQVRAATAAAYAAANAAYTAAAAYTATAATAANAAAATAANAAAAAAYAAYAANAAYAAAAYANAAAAYANAAADANAAAAYANAAAAYTAADANAAAAARSQARALLNAELERRLLEAMGL